MPPNFAPYVVFYPAGLLVILVVALVLLDWLKPMGQETAARVNAGAVALGVGLLVIAALVWLWAV